MLDRTCKVVEKNFSGVKTKDMKSYVIPTVEQKPDNIILHTGTNTLKTIDTPEDNYGNSQFSNDLQNGYKQRFYISYCPKNWQA